MLTTSVENGIRHVVSHCARWPFTGSGEASCSGFSTSGAGFGWLVSLVVVFAVASMVIAVLVTQRHRLHARLKDPREEARRALAFHAYHDTLTGLPNRAFLMRELEEALALTGDPMVAVRVIDLEGFN